MVIAALKSIDDRFAYNKNTMYIDEVLLFMVMDSMPFFYRVVKLVKKSHKIDFLFFYFGQGKLKKEHQKLLDNVSESELRIGTANEAVNNVIISLTSYPERFNSLTITLKSLLLQKVKPQHIIVWYDCSGSELTKELREFEKYGVTFRHVDIDLKPHKKYFFAMKEFPDSIIITVDDDMVYPSDLVETLLNSYNKHPLCVSARKVHRMTMSNDMKLDKYSNWRLQFRGQKRESHLLFAVGCGGVLYPPHCLDERAFNSHIIIENCLYADDIWLKYMEVLNHTKVVWAKNRMPILPAVAGSQIRRLCDENLYNNRNDFYIERMDRLYGEEFWKNLKTEK